MSITYSYLNYQVGFLFHNATSSIQFLKIKEWHHLVAFLHRIQKLFLTNDEKSYHEKIMGNIKEIRNRIFK